MLKNIMIFFKLAILTPLESDKCVQEGFYFHFVEENSDMITKVEIKNHKNWVLNPRVSRVIEFSRVEEARGSYVNHPFVQNYLQMFSEVKIVKIEFDRIKSSNVYYNYPIHIVFESGNEIVIIKDDLVRTRSQSRHNTLLNHNSINSYWVKNIFGHSETPIVVPKKFVKLKLNWKQYKYHLMTGVLVCFSISIYLHIK